MDENKKEICWFNVIVSLIILPCLYVLIDFILEVYL